jgi:hypothetical protein
MEQTSVSKWNANSMQTREGINPTFHGEHKGGKVQDLDPKHFKVLAGHHTSSLGRQVKLLPTVVAREHAQLLCADHYAPPTCPQAPRPRQPHSLAVWRAAK